MDTLDTGPPFGFTGTPAALFQDWDLEPEECNFPPIKPFTISHSPMGASENVENFSSTPRTSLPFMSGKYGSLISSGYNLLYIYYIQGTLYTSSLILIITLQNSYHPHLRKRNPGPKKIN